MCIIVIEYFEETARKLPQNINFHDVVYGLMLQARKVTVNHRQALTFLH